MNILLTSAEVFPYVKVGGLADVSSALPKEWEKLGHTVIIVMPKYREIDTGKYGIHPTNILLSIPMGFWTEYARLWQGTLPGTTVPVYFIDAPEYFDRDGVYGNPEGYEDNDRRYIFLSRAVFEAAKALDFYPDIIHANDYHTAFTMPFLNIHYRHDKHFFRTAGVYSIHNMIFQGQFNAQRVLPWAGIRLQEFYPGSWFEHQGAVNAMKVGIMFADKITTVSPQYAKEIRYTQEGYGLQDVLNQRGADFIGILNGVDYTEWNPATDAHIYATYSPGNPQGKSVNKQQYLRESGVAEHEIFADLPLVGMISRLTDQKGISLVEQALEHLLKEYPIRFTVLGSGAARYENFFRYIGNKYASRAIIHIGYNDILSHKVEAATDIFLMPSLFEPCGLNQMYSLKYGTIPVVRSTGGLADTVFEYNQTTGEGNGFIFYQYSADDMIRAVDRAVNTYYNKPVWQRIMHNAMTSDHSATKSAQEYIHVFYWAQEKR